MIEKLREVFFKHDPMSLGVKENNLLDEYDAEIELIEENKAAVENEEEVIELLEFVFLEMFEMVPEFSDEFIADVKAVML